MSTTPKAPNSPPEHPIRKRRYWWVWLLAVVVILIVGGAVLWHHHEAKEKAAAAARRAAAAAVTITSATAQKGDIGVYLDSIGTVTPVFTDSITSQVSGLIVSVSYKESQLVRKGDPLVDIDPRAFRATLLQAQGTLERDENVLAQAQMDLDRFRAALARNAIAEQQTADQEKLVLQDQGTVKNDLGAVEFDQVQLDYCHITAPISGQVGLRLVDPGNVAQSNGTQTLVVITQLQPITVIFTIAEDSLGPVEARLRKV